MMMLGTYTNKPAGYQSNWDILSSFWEDFGQYYAPPVQRRMQQDTSLLESVADKHRENTLIMLSRDIFNRQGHLFSKLGKHYEWTKEQAEQYRKKANTNAKLDYTPEIVHNSLPNTSRMSSGCCSITVLPCICTLI
jgi:hypothetical protein